MPCDTASFLKPCSQLPNVAGLAQPAAYAPVETAIGAKNIATARPRIEVKAVVEVEREARREGLRIASL